jgi:hypothetical protein
MKRLSAALIFGFWVLPLCFAQIQTGNASYNASKAGFTLSHSTMSFNTRVKVTNLQNNRSIEAVVNGRIDISPERIADISKDAGDALGLNKNGMTLVQLEELPFRRAEPAAAPPALPDTGPAPQPPAQPAPNTGPAPRPDAPSVVTQILPLQTVTEYVQAPSVPAQPCCSAFLLLAVFLLLILVIVLLVVILVLLLRRPLWPWHYPLWMRRYYRYVKGLRKGP